MFAVVILHLNIAYIYIYSSLCVFKVTPQVNHANVVFFITMSYMIIQSKVKM